MQQTSDQPHAFHSQRTWIDTHVHVLPEGRGWEREQLLQEDAWFARCHANGERMLTIEALKEQCAAGTIGRVMAMSWPFADPGRCREATEILCAAVAGVAHIKPLGMVNPAATTVSSDIAHARAAGVCGIGEVNADAQGWRDDPMTFWNLMDTCNGLMLPVVMHTAEAGERDYPGKGTMTGHDLATVIRGIPCAGNLILSHGGGALHEPEFESQRRLWKSAIFIDVAAAPWLYGPSMLRTFIAAYGSDRILFGSDAPRFMQQRYLGWLDAAELTQPEYLQITEQNAEQLYKWDA